jgi:putative transcriptional regulator
MTKRLQLDPGNPPKLGPAQVARLDAMTEEGIMAAALADPDAQPLTEEDLSRMKRVSRVKTIRHAAELTQEEFSKRYRIPLGTLRDWEQGRSEPAPTAEAYLMLIAYDPKYCGCWHRRPVERARSTSVSCSGVAPG